MKKKAIRITKSAFSLALALCMLFSCVIQSGAAQIASEPVAYNSMDGRLYFDNSKTSWSNVYLYVGHSSYARSYTLTNTGYHNIWYIDFSGGFTDRTKLYFANHNDSPNGQSYSIDTQYNWNTNNSTRTALTTANNSDSGSLFTPSSASAGSLSRSYPRVVAGEIASNGWDDCTDIMTYSSSQWTKTYSNVAAGSYSLAVVGFYNDWSPTYRWSEKGTLTANNIASWADANDSDHNIKLTTTAKSNITITLTSSNKVNITVNPVTYNVSLGTVSNGSITRSDTTAYEGKTVTLTTSPNTGYNDVKPTVTKSGGGTVTVTKTANNTYTFTMPGVSVTVTATFTIKSYDITFSQPTNGSIKVNNSTSSPVSVNHGSSVSLVITPNSGYKIKTLTDNGSAVSAAVGKTSAYTYTINSVTAAHTIAATMESANTPLAAPSIKMNNGTSNVSVMAAKGQKVSLSWASVTNAGSYDIYKGGEFVTNTTSTSYNIERAASSTGAYTVIAVPSNTTLYSSSAESNAITLTVSKVKLADPTVTPDATEKAINCTFTFSLTNTNSSYTAGTDYKYQHTGAGNTTYADISNLSWTTDSLTTTGNRTYKFKATAVATDYFADSDEVSVTVKACAKAVYSLTGDMVTGSGGDTGWPTAITTYPVDTFVSENVFYRTVTVSGGGTNDKHYFRLTDQSSQYTKTSGEDTDMSTHNSSSTAVTASTKGTNGAMYVTGNGNFKVYVDQSTSGSPKVWVVSNEWSLSISPYYQTFNLETDSHNAAAAGTTGGTVSGTTEVIKGQSTTLTATAASGYTFDGWYTSTDFTSNTKVSSNASYTFTPSANGDYYALFKENTPTHYTISVATVANAEVRATYNGTTHQEGSSFSAPKGASIVLYCVADTGYQAVLSPSVVAPNYSFTVSANTTVTATVTKINYALTGVVSPSAANSATGTIKFYSNSGCTTEITTATYQQTFYAKYTPPSEYYELSSFTISGTGSSKTGTSGNIGTFKMGYANATVTANVVAATPTFGTCPNMEVYAGESFTYNGATLATLPNSTLTYSFNGSAYQSSKTFTAPATAGTCTLVIKATNQPTGITTAATATKNVTITVKYREKNVTYYVDMHNNNMTDKTVEVAIVSNAGGGTVLQYGNNQYYESTLTKQGSSTVYAATVATPATKNESNNEYNSIYVRVKYGTDSRVVSLGRTEVTALMNSSSPEVWIEALNEAGNTFKVTYATNSNPAVESGKKRIYVAKPYGWQDTEPSWKNLRLYHWGDYTDIGWDQTPKMNYIGHDSNYHYYYVDVASNINNIIFQGWEDNSQSPNVQTGNIENIGSSNYFVLSKDGGSYVGTKGDNATVPGYTRYVDRVNMNVGDNANISPTHTGAKVTYTSSSPNVTVSSAGVVSATASATATITVKIFGTVGAKVTSDNPADMMQYTVNVSVRNPGVFSGYKIMSFAHQEYTLTIPKVSNTQPGYFVLEDTSATVNGLYDGSAYTASYANSAIIKSKATVNVSGVGAMPTSFTVKYAASNSSKGYANITLNDATVVTRSIRISDGQRYGFSEWDPAQASVSQSKIIDNGVETVTHKGFAFTSGTSTYQAVFAPYTYVDVTFTFNYDEYVPRTVEETEMVNGVETVVRTITNYQYESDWASQSGSHTTKTYVVPDFEVRNYDSSSVTNTALATAALKAIEVLPESNYYNYSIAAENITKTENGTYKANATVNLTKSLRKYKVYLNGNALRVDGTFEGTADVKEFNYQEYVDLNTGSTVSKWYAVNSSTATDTSNSPLLATGTGYKFRVKGDTYLRTVGGTIADDAFNRSENGFANYEITHRESGSTMKEYLLQNFYIADFFDKDKVKDLTRDDTPKADEANFVGGGVVYYSMNGVTESSSGTPYSKAVDAGYVNSDGTINADEVKAMLKRNIEANYSHYASLAAAIGEEDAMKVVYGQKIDVTNHKENGTKTGVLYRYLPLENYSVDANNNITTTLNSDVFRYSNSLQSYQYVYASGNENKATNNGKNMRLYSYFIYSYLSYDKDTNLPQTKYEVVLSDQYSDASTYWDGN